MPHYNGDVWDVDLLADSGKVINITARVRQLKTHIGLLVQAINLLIIKIIDYAKVCKILKLSGPNDFDIVLDEQGIPKILDAVSRFSGSVEYSCVWSKYAFTNYQIYIEITL